MSQQQLRQQQTQEGADEEEEAELRLCAGSQRLQEQEVKTRLLMRTLTRWSGARTDARLEPSNPDFSHSRRTR